MEKIADFDDADEVIAYVAKHAPQAERLPALEDGLCHAADYLVWVERTTGLAWWAAPEELNEPPIALWQEPAGDAATTFEDLLSFFGYLDRVGDETGTEFCYWDEKPRMPVDVDADYDVLNELWTLYQVQAEQRAAKLGIPAGQLLDGQLLAEMRAASLRLGYLTARRAAHIQAIYGTDRGWLAAASRDLERSHSTLRQVVNNGEHRRAAQKTALEEWRQEQASW